MAIATAGAKQGKAKPELARAELLDKPTRTRLEQELEGALKRRPGPGQESKLAGALRALAPESPALATVLAEAASVLVRRASFDRELYHASLRTLAEQSDKRAAQLVCEALATETSGGSSAFSAACFCSSKDLAAPLSKLAASRQSYVAFMAETARIARGESNGALLLRLAPMIKEAHRITLTGDLFVPLARNPRLPASVGAALAVLREAERHLGRWLVLGEVSARAGDSQPATEAAKQAVSGPESSRGAWTFVAWALRVLMNDAGDAGAPPTVRPTVELVARLSDRPSAQRDMSFLFRLAERGAPSCRNMLEAMVKGDELDSENAVRAAGFLARGYGRDDLRKSLEHCARAGRREDLRGLATAALWDVGAGRRTGGAGGQRAAAELATAGDASTTDTAREIAGELSLSRSLHNVAWAALVRAAAAKRAPSGPVVTETRVRWLQWGWLE